MEHWLPPATPSVARSEWAPLKRSKEAGTAELAELEKQLKEELNAIRAVEAPPPIRIDVDRQPEPRPFTANEYRLEPIARSGDTSLVTRSLSSLRLADMFSADGSASSDNSSEYADGLPLVNSVGAEGQPLVNVFSAEQLAGQIDVMDDDDADTSWEL